MPVRLVKGPLPVSFTYRLMSEFLKSEIKNEGGLHILMRNRVTKTWDGSYPDPQDPSHAKRISRAQGIPHFENKIDAPGGTAWLGFKIRLANVNTYGGKKWIWLGFGTSKRYAHMKKRPKFKRKTRPRFIASYPGRGGFSHLGPPLAGIKAREWDDVIAKKRKKKEMERFAKAIGEAIFFGVGGTIVINVGSKNVRGGLS